MNTLKRFIITGIIFVSVLGTIFHFIYNLSGKSLLVGFISPINESTWEHTKLLFFPMVFYYLIWGKRVSHKYPAFLSAMAFGALIGILLIIVIFYTYTGILGYNLAVIDILSFYISVCAAFYIALRCTISGSIGKYKNILVVLVGIVFVLFVIFTVFPPNLPLFISP